MAEPPATTDPQPPTSSPGQTRDGTSTTALALGVAALATAIIPYAVMLAVPMAIVAVVLGVVSRPAGNRRHATTGIVTGALAIGVALVWSGLLFSTYFGSMIGFRSDERVTSTVQFGVEAVEVEARRSPGPARAAPPPGEPTGAATPEPTVEATPPGEVHDLEGRGSVEVTGFALDEPLQMDLDVCRFPASRSGRPAIDGGPARTYSGHGPDGGVVVTLAGDAVTVVITASDGPTIVAEGRRRGGGASTGGAILDRRRLTVDGDFRAPLQDMVLVSGRLELTCR